MFNVSFNPEIGQVRRQLDYRTHTLAVDMTQVKMLLGLIELKQDSPTSPVSPVSSPGPKTK